MISTGHMPEHAQPLCKGLGAAVSPECRCLLMAGKRPCPAAAPRPVFTSSDLGLLGHLEGVINLDAEVAHGTLDLAVT